MVLLFVVWLPAMHAQTTPDTLGATANQTQLHPDVRIPVVPLGYLPPGDLPAFYYYAMVDLHFIDADHLMFAFNTPVLLKRDNNCPDSDVQRMVQAVVFQLPSGKVLKQTHWELYDFMDFLWGLGDGRLLLRRCNQLETVGADLNPKPLIQAIGTIEDISFSPDHSLVVVQEKVKPDAQDKDRGNLPSVLAQETDAPRTNISFIQLHPLHILGRAEVPLPTVIPVIANGLFEVLTAPHDKWVVNMQVFHGAQHQIATIRSLCPPLVQTISNTILMAETCSKGDQKEFGGYDLQGSLLWQIPVAPDQYYPRLITIPNGPHFAIESLRLNHPHAALDPLTKEDVAGEDINIYDALSGVRVATFQTTPAYTGGRNVDFSLDGQRMAVLHDGAIEIYSLNNLIKALPGMAR
ncbi:MAG TPA: hypothetical protein VMF56_11715 [Acidobacteriaceae bacterium]|nr:hypothetical protein [Acidobacteriaceae bacterium]